MRLLFRYIKEKRITLLLYFLTVFFFVAVGCLSHIENLNILLYAALLTLVVWGIIGFLQGLKYVRRSLRLEEAFRHFEQSGSLLPNKYADPKLESEEDRIETAEDFNSAYARLLFLICEKQEKEKRHWEERSADSKNYYMMWTHQIKTPISALRLLLEESGLPDKNSFLMKEELFKIEQYVEMALTFQRLESISSDLVLQEYDLDLLVKQAVKKYSVLFINKGLRLELQEMNRKILTDEKWFIFCLEQLLSNSIKYTFQGGIFIRAEKTENKLKLSIEDTGIGIRPEDLPRIFERGFTGYNGRLDKRSTGIGLFLCRQIFTHLGITIKVESEEGKGTLVALGIPEAKENSPCFPKIT